MNWTKDESSGMLLLSAVSKATNQKELIVDLLETFNKIQSEKLFTNDEMQIYVDATNGNLFFSATDIHGEPIDSMKLYLNMPEIWETGDSLEFDELAISSIKQAVKESGIHKTKKIFIEDELGNKIYLK